MTTLSLIFIFSFAAQAEPLQDLNLKIKKAGARWEAGNTSVSNLTLAQMRSMMDKALDSHPEVQFEVNTTSATAQNLAIAPSLDWRNKAGQNWMSAIRHQGSCGSCLAFAATATVEAQYRISQNKSYKLSPQFIFSCGGGICKKGWYPEKAASFLKSTGVPDESCMPYTSASGADISCQKACGDVTSRSVKITSYSQPTAGAKNIAAIKSALQDGPLVASMSAYRDFMSYKRGIYKRVSNTYVGGHAIVIIGYNDQERYLLIRNSWGTSWGESGYAKISYDDTSGIGSKTWKYEVPKNRILNLVNLSSSTAPRSPASSPPEAFKFMLNQKDSADTESIVLLLEGPTDFSGEIEFHQIHNGKEKIVPVTWSGRSLSISIKSAFLMPGPWEFYVTSKGSDGTIEATRRVSANIERQ